MMKFRCCMRLKGVEFYVKKNQKNVLCVTAVCALMGLAGVAGASPLNDPDAPAYVERTVVADGAKAKAEAPTTETLPVTVPHMLPHVAVCAVEAKQAPVEWKLGTDNLGDWKYGGKYGYKGKPELGSDKAFGG